MEGFVELLLEVMIATALISSLGLIVKVRKPYFGEVVLYIKPGFEFILVDSGLRGNEGLINAPVPSSTCKFVFLVLS